MLRCPARQRAVGAAERARAAPERLRGHLLDVRSAANEDVSGKRWPYFLSIRRLLHEDQYQEIPGTDRNLLRQCRVGIVLRDLQERTHPHPPLADNSQP